MCSTMNVSFNIRFIPLGQNLSENKFMCLEKYLNSFNALKYSSLITFIK